MNDTRLQLLHSLLPRCLTRDWVRLGARLVRLLRDQHHAGRHDEILDRLLVQARQSVECRERRKQRVPRPTYPESLPIVACKEEIVAAIRTHPVVVIAGETGSGKTTQIPKMCLEAGLGIEAMIGCTQPRRVAALSISRRIAEELDVTWGREVGCKIRFDDRSGPETFIKLMTDGILLAETQGDPLLADYNALIIDEAHERSLNIDFLLGYLKGLLDRRRDFKLIITSATINTRAFSHAFHEAPIIEVSGRTFPVEVVYEPPELDADDPTEVSAVEAAVRATLRVVDQSWDGDVLIFLPTERDIREAADQIEGRLGASVTVVPLFGRLSAGDQQRVFAPAPTRKIVVATNIAETSLTIPGIRFVVDSGWARISRYNPRTRTRRLPIEPVSQSSARQRQGRAGRVEAGVCIRLYSEEDFLARPAYTQPEIQRANLAEVILRMKAFRLGDPETFPFLDPPTPAALSAGYHLLHELGAVDADRHLTALGHDLARLPIDPTLGRMVLHARREHATRELLIIAAGLSIQDPRERPLEHQAAADAAHRRYRHPASDFLGLLNLWNVVHEQWKSLRTQGQRRRFCREQFLSYLRLREWQDLESQLEEALHELLDERHDSPTAEIRRENQGAAAVPGDPFYDAIHRSILAGLLGHVARAEQRNQYRASGNRLVVLFPGSTLFLRPEPSRQTASRRRATEATPSKSAQPEWIVAGELVETSQLFARTVAGIDPDWIPDLAPHLVKVTHQHPRWIASAGQVVIDEITTFHGLEVRRRRVAFANLDPPAAAALFIRSALVEEELLPSRRREAAGFDEAEEPGWPKAPESTEETMPPQYRFLSHNRHLREKIESWQTRLRRHVIAVEDALFQFYSARLGTVASVAELNRWLQASGGPEALYAEEHALSGGRDLTVDTTAFPEAIALDGQPVSLSYVYAPGEERDGVTVRLPFALVDSVAPALLDWAVPGLRAGLVEEWLRALPKALRRQLQPIPPKVAEIVRELHPVGPTLSHDLARFLRQRYGLEVPAGDVAAESLPVHFRPRVEVIGPDQRVLASGRDLVSLRSRLPAVRPAEPTESPLWKKAAQAWERFDLCDWTFGDVPARLELAAPGSPPLRAWPALEWEDGQVNLRLFASETAARRASDQGFPRLVERALQRELGWLQKDLRATARLLPFYAGLGTADTLPEAAFEHARRHVIPTGAPSALTRAAFEEAVAHGRQRLAGLASPLLDRLATVLELRQQVIQRLGIQPRTAANSGRPATKDLAQLDQLLAASRTPVKTPTSGWARELERLIPLRFPETIPFDRLMHFPRYLKALLLRIDRAAQNPPRDVERQKQIEPFATALMDLMATEPGTSERKKALEEFRWFVEEFRVSLFAQELGTAVPVSSKRLSERLSQLRSG